MAPAEQKSMNSQELTEAIGQLLRRDEVQIAQERRKRRRRILKRRQERDARIAQLTQSIEVIKWFIVGIASFMAMSLLVVILVVMEVEREAERIKGEVQEIQREAEAIRDKIRHPFESFGSSLGRQLENSIFGSRTEEK